MTLFLLGYFCGMVFTVAAYFAGKAYESHRWHEFESGDEEGIKKWLLDE